MKPSYAITQLPSVMRRVGTACCAGLFSIFFGAPLPLRAAAKLVVEPSGGLPPLEVRAREDKPVLTQSLQDIRQVVADHARFTALRNDGSVVSWDNRGETLVPLAGLRGARQIALGSEHWLALRSNGTVAAYGSNSLGQRQVPSYVRGVESIAAAYDQSMAVTRLGDGETWGHLGFSVPGMRSGTVAQVVAGRNFGAALIKEGTVSVWGKNNLSTWLNVPPNLSGVMEIAAGAEHCLALRADGTVCAWGVDKVGETAVPEGLAGVCAIAAGDRFSCALKRDGTVSIWGQPGYVEWIGNAGPVTAISAGMDRLVIRRMQTGEFGLVNRGKSTALDLTIRSVGSEPLWIEKLAIVGRDAAHFRLDEGGMKYHLGNAETGTLRVTFWPRSAGRKLAFLRVYGNGGPGRWVDVPLTGRGVLDAVPRPRNAPEVITIEAESAQGTALRPDWFAADDPGETVPLVVTTEPPLGTVLKLGRTQVLARFTDAAGHMVERSCTVNVLDRLPPVFTSFPRDVVVDYAGRDGAVVNYPLAMAVDAAGVAEVRYSHASGSVFPPGLTKVSVEARDAGGRLARGHFRVLVRCPFLAADADGTVLAEGRQHGVLRTSGASQEGETDTLSLGHRLAEGMVGSDGSLHATAYRVSNYRTLAEPLILGDVRTHASSGSLGMAVLWDGTVQAWYGNPYWDFALYPWAPSAVYEPAPSPNVRDAVGIEAGYDKLLQTGAGKVVPWKGNPGRLPGWLPAVTDIAASERESAALLADGRVIAWNVDGVWSLTMPSGAGRAVQLEGAAAFFAALTDTGKVVRWDRLWPSNQFKGVMLKMTEVTDIAASGVGDWVAGVNGQREVQFRSTVAGTVVFPFGNTSREPVQVAEVGGQVFSSGSLGATIVGLLQPREVATPLDFGLVNEGLVTPVRLVRLANRGNAPATVTGATLEGDASFALESISFPITLPVGGSAEFGLTFAPQTAGMAEASLHLASDGLEPELVVPLVGEGKLNTPPELRLPVDPVVVEAGGELTLPSGVTTDLGELQPVVVSMDPPAGTLLPLGDTLVRVRAVDVAGLWVEATFTVRVIDTTPPRIGLTEALVVPPDDAAGAVVNFSLPPVEDLSGVASIVAVPASGSVFPVGTSLVTVIAVDQAGNSGERKFAVTVTQPRPRLVVEDEGARRLLTRWVTWGNATAVPQGMVDGVDVATGEGRWIFLERNGVVRQMIGNTEGSQLATVAHPAKAIACGGGVAVLLQDGGVTHWNTPWGSSYLSSTEVISGGARRIALAATYGLALMDDGAVWVWSFSSRSVPTVGGVAAVPVFGSKVVDIAAADDRAFALLEDGSVVHWSALVSPSWSWNSWSAEPVLRDVNAISARQGEFLALSADGLVTRWGRQSGGVNIPVPDEAQGAVSVTAQPSQHIAFMPDGTVVRWPQAAQPVLENLVAVAETGGSGLALSTSGQMGAEELGMAVPGGAVERVFRLENPGPGPLHGAVVAITGGGAGGTFRLAAPLPAVIAAGDSAEIRVLYDAVSLVANQAQLQVTLPGEPGTFCEVPLIVSAAAPALKVTPSGYLANGTLDFGRAYAGDIVERQFVVKNTGGSLLRAIPLLEGADAADFSVRMDPPGALASGAEGRLIVTFRAQSAGHREGRLSVSLAGADAAGYQIDLAAVCDPLFVEMVLDDGSEAEVQPGSTSALGALPYLGALVREFRITNRGAQSLTGLHLALGTFSGIELLDSLPSTLGAGETAVVRLGYVAAGPGTATGSLTVEGDGLEPLRYRVLGHNVAPVARIFHEGGAEIGVGDSMVRLWNGQENNDASIPNARVIAVGHAEAWVVGPTGEVRWVGSDYSGLELGGRAPFLVGSVAQIAAGYAHVAALLADGSVAWWGKPELGRTLNPFAREEEDWKHLWQSNQDVWSSIWWASTVSTISTTGTGFASPRLLPVPAAAQYSVVAVSAGGAQVMALKQDGSIVAWGSVWDGSAWVDAQVPPGLPAFKAIAAGSSHGMGLRADGGVEAWGMMRIDGADVPAWVPEGLSGVTAIAAGWSHCLALLSDGSVRAWGADNAGQVSGVDGCTGVSAIAAGEAQSVVVRADGSVAAWGLQAGRLGLRSAAPSGPVQRASAIAAGGQMAGAIGLAPPLNFGVQHLGGQVSCRVLVRNGYDGFLPLPDGSSAELEALEITGWRMEGDDAGDFFLASALPTPVAHRDHAELDIVFAPLAAGQRQAELVLQTNDPFRPEVRIGLFGNGILQATPAAVRGSQFSFSTLRVDSTTGRVLQTIQFTNQWGRNLPGLLLRIYRLAPGVSLPNARSGSTYGEVNVAYTQSVAADETIRFDLAYVDPYRRTSTDVQPTIWAEPLAASEFPPGPVGGVETRLLQCINTTQGPLIEWAAVKNRIYVIEYSDDAGATWFSAVHLLRALGTRMRWIDRGQPETWAKPTGPANGFAHPPAGSRFYRVKLLPEGSP